MVYLSKMLKITDPYIEGNELKYVTDVIKSKWLSIGKYIELFEEAFADYLGVKYAVSVCNGTSALHLALSAIGVTKTDNVILPTHSYIATAEAAKYCTDDLTFVSIDNKTWNINTKKIELKNNTKVILPVHLYGNPANMQKIMKLAKENNVFVVEDAAEALGAKYKNKFVGTIGDIGCFSFFGNKNLAVGEGGMCVTNNESLYNKMLKLRHHGETVTRYIHDEVGFNYRMSNLTAAVGLAQLEQIEEILKKKTEIKRIYDGMLINDDIILQKSYKYAEPINWIYAIKFKNLHIKNAVETELQKHKIETRNIFYPMNSMKPYGNLKVRNNDISYTGINLPSSPYLDIFNQIQIINLIEGVINKRGVINEK